MKYLWLLLVLYQMNFTCFSQLKESGDEEAVKQKIEAFFMALETQDTTLYKEILFTKGQVWWVKQEHDSVRYNTRYFGDDIKRFSSDRVIEETALDYDIKVHQNIAVAWVPYTLDINGEFSHCGVDVFTLIKTDDWKIVNASFTIEPDGCKEVKELVSD